MVRELECEEEKEAPLNGSNSVFEAKTDQKLIDYFRTHGFVVLENALTSEEVMHFVQLYDDDRKKFGPPNCWHPFDGHQTRNCNALVTSPGFDSLIRHPKILSLIQFFLGGPVCFSEICLRHMLRMMENRINTFTVTAHIGRSIRYAWTTCNLCYT